MEANKVIKYPLSTEKAIRMMEAENKLIFIVERKAKKDEVKRAVEASFNVKVAGVTTSVGPDGKKRAFVRLSMDTPAIEVATRLGMM